MASPKNQALVAAIAASGPDMVGLQKASPLKASQLPSDAEGVIDLLFPGNPLLCAGWSSSEFATRKREDWRGELSQMQLLVPSPMSAVRGLTKRGYLSDHALQNTGHRRFLVAEFDGGSTDTQAALIAHLGALAPLVMVLHSGGKSLHAWFPCKGVSELLLLQFFRYAVSLGADPATWSRCQFVRMPQGLRDTGQRQAVHFFNPAALEGQ